jgi:hypothetical protein
MNTPDRPALAAALQHYGRVTLQLTELEGYDAVFDRRTATVHIDPSADLRAAVIAVMRELEGELTGEVERMFTVVDGALALASPRPDQQVERPWGLRIVEDYDENTG